MVKHAVTKYLDSFLTQHALLYHPYWKEGVWGLGTGRRCVFVLKYQSTPKDIGGRKSVMGEEYVGRAMMEKDFWA